MTIYTVYASSLASGSVSTPANALGSTAGTWTTDVDNTNWTARFAMENPGGGGLGGSTGSTHTLTLRVRKDEGTGDPVINSVTLYVNDVSQGTIGAGNWSVTSTTGEDVSITFSGDLVTNADTTEFLITVTSTGGSPAARATVQLDYVKWDGDFVVAPKLGSATGGFSFSGSATGARPTYGPWSSQDSETTLAGTINIDGTRTSTASASGTVLVVRTASGARTASATLSGTAFVVRTLSGTRPTTASHSGVAAVTRPASGSTSGTASISGAAAVIRPATGATTATANITGSAPGTISVDGARTVVAAPAGSGLSTAFASGTRSVTATLSGTGVVIKPVSGTTAVTAAPAGTANVTLSTMTGSRSVTASLAGEGEILILTQPSGTWIISHRVSVF